MKIHLCPRGGYVHDDLDPRQVAAWGRLPADLREALVEAERRIADVEEREGWAVADARHDLHAAKDRAIAALEAHPATRGVAPNPQWFRLTALVEEQARSNRCTMCYRRANHQLALGLSAEDDGLGQDDPPPPPRPAAPAAPAVKPPQPDAAQPPAAQPPAAQPAAAPLPRFAPPPADILPTADAARIAREALARLKESRGTRR